MKDYWDDKIFSDVKILNEYFIPFNIYYHLEYGKTFYKIYGYSTLVKSEKKTLKSLDFLIIDGEYEFTWDWIEITEEELELRVNSNKYNL